MNNIRSPKRPLLLNFNVSAEEKEAFRLIADTDGLKLSVWARLTLRRAAESELVERGLSVPFMFGSAQTEVI